MSLAQNGTSSHRSTSKLRSPALASYRTTGSGSVGAAFQLGGKFGVGRAGGIEKTSLYLAHVGRQADTATHGGEHSGAGGEGPSGWTAPRGQ
jgi:hypothetical protein